MAISFAKILLHSIRPGVEVLGRLPRSETFCEISQYPMATKAPGILIIRIDSGLLCFANANFVRERYSLSNISRPWHTHINDKNLYDIYSNIRSCQNHIRIGMFIFLPRNQVIEYPVHCFSMLCFRIIKWVADEEDAVEETVKGRVHAVVLDMSSKYFGLSNNSLT